MIPHDGGECPVDGWTLVAVWFRFAFNENDRYMIAYANELGWPNGDLGHPDVTDPYDITHYMPLEIEVESNE